MSNELQGWWDAIDSIHNKTKAEEDEWKKSLPDPIVILKLEDYELGIWKSILYGEDKVVTIRIGKNGPICSTAQSYDAKLINALKEVLDSKEVK